MGVKLRLDLSKYVGWIWLNHWIQKINGYFAESIRRSIPRTDKNGIKLIFGESYLLNQWNRKTLEYGTVTWHERMIFVFLWGDEVL